jgi:pimeloyl-ACP methyl ester carboxylesterase
MRRPGDKRRNCQGRSRTVPPARSAASAHCHGQRNRSVAASSIERSRVKYADYPFFQEFYHLNPSGRFRLAFKPRSSFKFYGGGNGPQALRMCGRIMDGLISSGTYIPMLKAGRLPGVVTNDDYKKCGFRRILVFSAAAHGSHRRQGSLNTRPTVGVRGEHDPISNQQWCEEIARMCPRGRLVIISGVAHTLCYTAPVQLADVTRSFVNDRDRM